MFLIKGPTHGTAYLPNRMTSVASPGLLALSKAQTYQSFDRSDTNPSCS